MNPLNYIIPGADDRPIAIDFYSAGPQFPLVIFVHGFKGFKDWGTHHLTAEYFLNHGFQFLKFNFSHNGVSLTEKDVFDELGSFGSNTFSKELEDLDKVISFALSGQKFTAPSDIYLIGHSRGGGISIIKTAEDDRIKKLVTWASINNFRDLWKKEQEDEWRKKGVIFVSNARTKQEMPLNLEILADYEINQARLSITNAATQVKQPWLIIHGETDSSVPVEKARELHSRQVSKNIALISDADHVFCARHPWQKSELPEKLKEVCDKSIHFFNS